MSLEESKLGSIRASAAAMDKGNERVSQDKIEEYKFEAIEHVRKYQANKVEIQNGEAEKYSARASSALKGG